jgi:hypothetical protein
MYDIYSNRFRWSASGATRYEIISQYGILMYSGAGTSFQFMGAEGIPNTATPRTGDQLTFTLKAYNGSNVTTRTTTVTYALLNDPGGS